METTTVPPEATGSPGRSRRWLGLPAAVRRLTRPLRPSERPARTTLWLVVTESPWPPRSDWFARGFTITEHEEWRDADAAYERAVGQAARSGTARVRLIPYRTHLRGDALVDELLALDDFEILPASRQFARTYTDSRA